MNRTIISFALWASALCGVTCAVEYQVTALGTLPGSNRYMIPTAINAAGTVVGTVDVGGYLQAAFWTADGGVQLLGGLPADTLRGNAQGINDAGQIVGRVQLANARSAAYLWDTTTSGRAISSYELGGNGAMDINNLGQVVGRADFSTTDEAFFWSESTGIQSLGPLVNMGTSIATGINDAGQVVGYGISNRSLSSEHAFIWTASTGLVDLGDLPGGSDNAHAQAINNSGVVVGDGQAATGYRAFQWTSDTGMVDLGEIPGGNNISLASDINSAGTIVGRSQTATGGHAVIWSSTGELQDLNLLLDSSGNGVTLDSAVSINDKGQIVATGFSIYLGLNIGFILTPVPEPSTVVLGGLSLLGFAVVIRARRRK